MHKDIIILRKKMVLHVLQCSNLTPQSFPPLFSFKLFQIL